MVIKPPIYQKAVVGVAQSITVSIVKSVFDAEFGEDGWWMAEYIIQHESGFNPYKMNTTSGACGLPQSLPCSKLLNSCGSLDNTTCQAEWMRDYIKGRYITLSSAYAFWLVHSWY